MVNVKIIKDTINNDLSKYIGKTYEAFIDNRYEDGYCVNLEDDIRFVQKECCKEIINTNKVLLVEDGSVDVDYIEDELKIKCIIYRQGSQKPEWLEIGE